MPRWLPVVTVAEGPSGVKAAELRLLDRTNDGKVDYSAVDEKTGKTTLWENIGTGGKYQPGEGVVLCDCKSYSYYFPPFQQVYLSKSPG